MNQKNPKAALIVIDLENGFVEEGAAHQIAMAKASIPACAKVITASREAEIPVIFVKRIYRQNGSDVEITRWQPWLNGGKAMTPSSCGLQSAEAPPEIKPKAGDYTIVKPRWSAFFQTELDLILRRLGVQLVILIGTTTPNCIRTTAYDANSLDYEVLIIEDCCTSATKEIQQANISDLKRMGAVITDSESYCQGLPRLPFENLVSAIRLNMEDTKDNPEPIQEMADGSVGWFDRW